MAIETETLTKREIIKTQKNHRSYQTKTIAPCMVAATSGGSATKTNMVRTSAQGVQVLILKLSLTTPTDPNAQRFIKALRIKYKSIRTRVELPALTARTILMHAATEAALTLILVTHQAIHLVKDNNTMSNTPLNPIITKMRKL